MDRLFHGSDFTGKTCGASGGQWFQNDLEFTYYPRLGEDLKALEKEGGLSAVSWFTQLHLYGLCVDHCPKKGDMVLDYGYDKGYPGSKCDPGVESGTHVCEWFVPVDTISVARRCLPAVQRSEETIKLCSHPTCWDARQPCYEGKGIDKSDGLWDASKAAICDQEVEYTVSRTVQPPHLGLVENLVGRFFGGLQGLIVDIGNAQWEIYAFGLWAAVISSLLLMLLMHCCMKQIFYGTAMVLLLLMVLLDAFLFAKAGVLELRGLTDSVDAVLGSNTSSQDAATGIYDTLQGATGFENNSSRYLVAGCVVLALWAATVGMLCCLRGRLDEAFDTVKEAITRVLQHPKLVLLPIGSLLLSTLVFGFMFVFAVVTFTSGTLSERELEERLPQVNASIVAKLHPHWMLLSVCVEGLMCLWLISLIDAICYTATALVIYKKSSVSLLQALGITLRYHLGSMAFGSLIIALMRAVRYVIAILRLFGAKQEKKKDETTMQTCLTNLPGAICQSLRKLFFCDLTCCFCLGSEMIETFTKLAYVNVGIHNKSFCDGAHKTLDDVRFNFITTEAVSLVVLFLEGLVVPLVSACLAYASVVGEWRMRLPYTSAYFINGEHDYGLPFIGHPTNWDETGRPNALTVAAVAFLLSYFTASSIQRVLRTAIDTVLVEGSKREAAAPAP